MFIKRSTAFILVHKQALVFKFSVNEDIKENNKCQFLSRQDFKPSPKDLYSTCQQSAANVQKICKNNNITLPVLSMTNEIACRPLSINHWQISFEENTTLKKNMKLILLLYSYGPLKSNHTMSL